MQKILESSIKENPSVHNSEICYLGDVRKCIQKVPDGEIDLNINVIIFSKIISYAPIISFLVRRVLFMNKTKSTSRYADA